ncbi:MULTISPECIES: autotransporter outer membrane beta-barrel domain-containing protein [unclassified Pseudomonas]|uniref:autotransporter outer membrane beta-barrel domain-containing protein n=1 Tax=unclassified Pseudomonas TaxID=196821 RepID=UPI00119B5285|nr:MULTISPECIES: autotransporter outer membrane beta-barrel domain-containing protein [unclassified Pseudomonas]TWC17618.1 outer membrane autotransporter protein [Pseudomonas sp. SJZ074]TWC19746.1 outer membrane autotransporter protein [Pseudomonas sp. SJZ075]TWC35354.1 outer membrane autotransporter protein [Pseudomonas sp. SJZ078]TWC35472.1 outer membrane autotransporter protein [Pseudomonas sp. SJZ085]TWC56300.1 outer membrane autotransporter protein [Pseudomonas sp. SJZ124]
MALWLRGSSLSLSLLLVEPTLAGTLVGQSQTITNGDPVETWSLSQNSTLNVNGAQTLGILASQSTLNTSGATTGRIIGRQGASINLSNTTVTGGNVLAGLELADSDATINGSTVTGNQLGLTALHVVGTTIGSTVTATNSTITGVTGGARATAFSVLDFSNSIVEGTGATSFGISLLSSTASASNGTRIIGGQNGVILGLETGVSEVNKLTLDQSSVEGRNGSAIVVDYAGTSAAVSQIDVLNGSTLTGSNGTILEVRGAGNAAMNVERSNLTGNVQVAGDGVAALAFTQASLTGDVRADAGGTATVALLQGSQMTGVMDNVATASIDQSSWVMTGDSQVGDLVLTGGTVRFGADNAFYRLNVESLSGNGLFEIGTDFATNQTDFLNVTGTATGSHQIMIASSGVDPASGQPIQVVHTGGGDATFALANADGAVDLGTYSYGLKQSDTGNDWFLDPTARTVSPSTRAVMALFNTAPTVWYGELSPLRSRMGELRFNSQKSGAWLRAYGNKYNVSDSYGGGYRQAQQGFALGADAPLPLGDGQWLLGVMAGHSTSDLDLHRGTSGTIKSYYIGTYLTWMDEDSGYYVDSVLKLNRFQNDAKVGMSDGKRSKGDYDNSGLGGSVEVGRNIKLNDGYFIEPFTQWSAVAIQGKDYHLDNGLQAEGDRTYSLLGKAGVTVGRDMQLDNGATVQPYVRAALAHEFAKNNEVKVNNNVFNNDLSGSRAELGAGIAVNLSQRWQAHAEVEYMNGKGIEMPIGGTVGVQFKW